MNATVLLITRVGCTNMKMLTNAETLNDTEPVKDDIYRCTAQFINIKPCVSCIQYNDGSMKMGYQSNKFISYHDLHDQT